MVSNWNLKIAFYICLYLDIFKIKSHFASTASVLRNVSFSFISEIKIDYVSFNKFLTKQRCQQWERMKDQEKKTETAIGAMMEQRRMLKGGRTESAKTRSGQFWTITIVFIAPEKQFWRFWETPKKETYTRSLSTGLFPFVEFVSSLGCIFWRSSVAYMSRGNSDRLAYIPLRFHSVFRVSLYERILQSASKKVFLSLEKRKFLFFQIEPTKHAWFVR